MILPLLACLTLVGASSAPLAVSLLPYGNELVPQCAVYDDTNSTITLTADELNNYTFTNLADCLIGLYNSYPEVGSAVFGNVTYLGELCTADEYLSNESMSWAGDTIWFYLQFADNTFEVDNVAFTASAVFDFSNMSQSFADIKTAVQADIEANQSGMSGVDLVGDIVDILVSGLSSFGTGIGSSISNFASALAFEDGALSPYFIIVLAFCAISLCVGITSRLFLWLGSLGRN